MPTMPLNQLAFLSEWLALRIVKRDGTCCHHRPKKRYPHSTPAYTLKWSSPTTRIAFLIAARLEPYSTVTFLPQQPRRIRQISPAIGNGICQIIEKRGCRARPSSFILQL